MSDYKISPINGGSGPIYNFYTSPDYLYEKIIGDDQKKDMYIYYFRYLYPMTDIKTWEDMNADTLESYYENLDFWYTFNSAFGVSPMPVLLSYSNNILERWEKNTFYQAGTIVQSGITSWGHGLNNEGKTEWLASRLNNSPQVDSKLTYTTKDGKQKTIANVCTDPDYWNTVLGEKIEVTSWGWNPYPYGLYSQGPFRGTGNFQEISKNTIVGTTHWSITHQCKADNITDSQLWSAIVNHEVINGLIPADFQMGPTNVSPSYIIKTKDGKWIWKNIGYVPFIITYFCFIMGGFGGIGDKWNGNNGPFWGSWTKGNGKWKPGWTYSMVFYEQDDGTYIFPEDQSIPEGANFGGLVRTSQYFWDTFKVMFDMLSAWDTNWIQERWKDNAYSYNYIYTDPNTGKKSPYYIYGNLAPVTINYSDSIMMAMVTGNFNVLGYKTNKYVYPGLSKFSGDPHLWSHSQLLDNTTVAGVVEGAIPTGMLTHKGSGYDFVIRTQMPNVNSDICTEFADFRICTPGALATGSGDQSLWKQFFTDYAKQFMFTVDPFNKNNYQSFDGDFSPIFPDVELKKVNLNNTNWKTQENVCTGKTFFDFDVYSGKNMANLAYTGKNEKSQDIVISQYPANIKNPEGYISLSNYVDHPSIKNCTPDPTLTLVPKPISSSLQQLGGNINCYIKNNYSCFNSQGNMEDLFNTSGCFTTAIEGQSYFPFATDNFNTGVIGAQANGIVANIGAAQTRWSMCSHGISWQYHAPLANRLILTTGIRNLDKFPIKNYSKVITSSKKTSNIILTVLALIIFIVIIVINVVRSIKIIPKTRKLINIISSIILVILFIVIIIVNIKKSSTPTSSESELKKLQIYLTLVYPLSRDRWMNMSKSQIQQFFCSLHHWYKGEGLPSPTDYLNTDMWNNTPPFGKGTSWNHFTTRKHCIVGQPQSFSEIDNKLEIGYDDEVDTTSTETPVGILFRGRQVLSRSANIQKTTFMEPSYNLYIDTFNSMPTVNDTNLDSWNNVNYVEVSSQWGPFPDGIYFDWAQGTGVWLELGKHIVGYNGLDVCRRAGDEVLALVNKGDLDIQTKFNNLWISEWQLSGIDNMLVGPTGKIYNQLPQGGICGYYGTVIMTKNQYEQVKDVKGNNIWGPTDNPYYTYLCADGEIYSTIAMLMGDNMQYYNVTTGSWQKTMPVDPGYILNYPFPLPYGSGIFTGDTKGNVNLNNISLKMPWKYQMFNMAMMTRYFVINAIFLDEFAIPEKDLDAKKGFYNYVDIIIANSKAPLKTLRTWEQAIDVIINLLQKPIAHPFFSIYGRVPGVFLDGPLAILLNPEEWLTSKVIGQGEIPSITRIQYGILDKDIYFQDTDQSKGVINMIAQDLPQFEAADVEIDHWMAVLSKIAGYDTAIRIQHWCGNKGLTYDIEIVNISESVPGNLGTGALYDNIYEIWKKSMENRFSIRDPFYDKNSVYPEVYQDIDTKSVTDQGEVAIWNKPPWIGFNPLASLYGWSVEQLIYYTINQRLSYCPASAQQVGFSNSYPEYNSYIMSHFMRNW